ncbi:factor V activator-like [Spodoptera litura]|uniref:Factor V activator-like n=1 Tax=Spodoptera litura TaxID=69820 RepID=A0A9J7DR78_SPOLT|nr:factor V activator-like [Spodoptera litura]
MKLLYLCLFYLLINNLEAKIVPLVYGGDPIPPDQHQYLVHLIKHHKNDRIPLCSGSILNNQWIISAAHCFTDDVLRVSVIKENEVLAEVISTNIFNYPGYVHYRSKYCGDMPLTNHKKDLALLKVDRRIDFNDKVQPIQLPKGPVRPYLEVTMAGYGYSEFESGEPRQGKAFVHNCMDGVKTNFICVSGSARIARGDSGGPLVANDTLVGVANCGNKIFFSRFVDVYSNLKWIEHVMASN